MPFEASTHMLQLIANPIRRSIIKSLEWAPISFTEAMRASGLDPNFDTGPFSYHLSVLLDYRIVEKVDNKYRLTSFGNKIADIMGSLERESKFLLEIDEVSEGGERMAGKIESRWLGPTDLIGQYGLIMGGPLEPAPYAKERRPEDEVFDSWEKKLPQLDTPPPSFYGYVMGFEKDGIRLGSMHVRFSKKRLNSTRTAEVLGVFIVDNNYRKIGETRASVLRQMLNEFSIQAGGHKTQLIKVKGVDAEDEDLVNALKQLGFERYQNSYAMQKTIS